MLKIRLDRPKMSETAVDGCLLVLNAVAHLNEISVT